MSVFSALLNNGPQLVGPLADRGAFDEYASYRPGQVVVDDGVTYLNIARTGADVALEDNFQRQDQQGWGQSSHGEVWQTSAGWAGNAPPRLLSGRGLLEIQSGPGPADGQLLGPSQARTNVELLLRLGLLGLPAGTLHLLAALSATEDAANFAGALLAVADDGTTTLQIQSEVDPASEQDSSSPAGPSLLVGADAWLRLRRIGAAYSLSAWLVGTPEPSAPQATLTADDPQPAGHPLLYVTNGAEGEGVSVAYFGVRPLTAADAPADDADHWVALADALQVPQPL